MQTGKVGFGAERIAVSTLKAQDQPTLAETMVVVVLAEPGTAVALSVARQRYAPTVVVSE